MDIKSNGNGNYAIRPQDETERTTLVEACMESVSHLAQTGGKEPQFFELVMLPLSKVAIETENGVAITDNDTRTGRFGRKTSPEDRDNRDIKTLEVDELTLKNIGYALQRFHRARGELATLCFRLGLDGDPNNPIVERLQRCVVASRMFHEIAKVVELEP